VRASKQSFFKRTDLFAIRKIAETYNDKEVVDFLVANFITGDRWGGVFDTEAKTNYLQWKKRMESMSYTFENDIDKIQLLMEKNGYSFTDIFQCSKGKHPVLLKMYLKKAISIETLVILNKINNFVDDFDQKLDGDLMWPDVSRIIKKYSPFLTINKEKYKDVIRRRN
jgi:hypothetical protein